MHSATTQKSAMFSLECSLPVLTEREYYRPTPKFYQPHCCFFLRNNGAFTPTLQNSSLCGGFGLKSCGSSVFANSLQGFPPAANKLLLRSPENSFGGRINRHYSGPKEGVHNSEPRS